MIDYTDKTLLIIGAGLLQVPAIKIASECGLTTVVSDYNENAPGMKIADYPVIISTRDIEGTVREMKKFNAKRKIDGVITVGTDASMTVAAVSNALNLPGIKFENAEAASNKIKMRERLKANNVPVPDFRKIWSYDELLNALKVLKLPLVIKPSDNMGARGVMKIESFEMAEKAFYHAKEGSPSGELIVEEYMKGDELSIDALVYKGEIHITGIADRLIEGEPYFIEKGHVMPSSKDENVLSDAVSVFKAGIKALGIDMGAAKGDIKITESGAKIGEIAARLSGGFMSAYTYPYSSGVNLIKNAIDIALGIEPSNLIPTKNWVSIEKAVIPLPGKLKEIRGLEEAHSIHGVKNIFINNEIGDDIKEPRSNVEKPLNFIIVRETREAAWECVKEVERTIEVVTDNYYELTWPEIEKNARKKFNRMCFVCPVCNGKECRGLIPGMGGIGRGNSFVRNYDDLQGITIVTSTINSSENVDMSCDFFGHRLDIPLLAAPITGCDINLGGQIAELEYDESVIEGCKKSGIMGFTGDGAQSYLFRIGLQALKESGNHGGIIYKPRSSDSDLKLRFETAMSQGVPFIGVDIDAAAFVTMELMGQKVGPMTLERLCELREMVSSVFIIKGVMSTKDAELAVSCGADAIVVSNHGGRITDNHSSSISVLKSIADVVDKKCRIIFDGGVRSGEDIYKAIAHGADYVMVGRPFSIAALGGGVKGVQLLVERYKKELSRIMMLTNCKSIKDINPGLINSPFV